MAHAISRMSLARTGREFVALSTILGACSGGGGSPNAPAPPVLTTLAVSLSALPVQVGWTDTASAKGFDQRGDSITIGAPVWTTSSSAIATVDSRGVVTGVAIGLASIIATVGGKQGQIALPVVPVAVASVVVDPPGASAAPGETVQFTATTLDAVGDTLTDRRVTWSSTEAAVATVSPAGLVTAVTVGTAIIVASSEAASGAAGVIVTGAIVPGVTIAIATPIRDQVFTDTLSIHAVAYSDYPITGIVASVGSQRMTLAPVGRGGYGGKMLLAGTFYGTFQVVLTATDERNAIGIDSMEFVRKKIVLGGNGPAPGKKQLVPADPVKIP